MKVRGFFTTTRLWVGVRYGFDGVRLGVLDGVDAEENFLFLLGVRGSVAEVSFVGSY